MRTYTQEEINNLISCPKIIKDPPKKNLQLERGHYRNEMDLISVDDNHKFHVFMRKHATFEENFTIGLDYYPEDGSGSVCLLRCNGPHGEHINDLVGNDPHFGYHIHQALAENVNEGLKSEIFAHITKEYSTFDDAVAYFIQKCNINKADKYFPSTKQLSLFEDQEL